MAIVTKKKSGPVYSADLKQIKKSCSSTVSYDQGTGRVVVRASCILRDAKGNPKKFSHDFDVTDLVNHFHDQFGVHDRVNGWFSDTWDSAVNAARKVAENRFAKTMYQEVLPDVAPFVPGGAQVMAVANRAAKIVEQAKAGKKSAIKKIAKVKKLAESGNDEAAEVLEMMRQMLAMMKDKEQGEVAGWLYNKPFRSNTEALDLSVSPGSLARHLYSTGIGRSEAQGSIGKYLREMVRVRQPEAA